MAPITSSSVSPAKMGESSHSPVRAGGQARAGRSCEHLFAKGKGQDEEGQEPGGTEEEVSTRQGRIMRWLIPFARAGRAIHRPTSRSKRGNAPTRPARWRLGKEHHHVRQRSEPALGPGPMRQHQRGVEDRQQHRRHQRHNGGHRGDRGCRASAIQPTWPAVRQGEEDSGAIGAILTVTRSTDGTAQDQVKRNLYADKMTC